MKKDLDYYLSLNYPIESYFGEHEIGDAYLRSEERRVGKECRL